MPKIESNIKVTPSTYIGNLDDCDTSDFQDGNTSAESNQDFIRRANKSKSGNGFRTDKLRKKVLDISSDDEQDSSLLELSQSDRLDTEFSDESSSVTSFTQRQKSTNKKIKHKEKHYLKDRRLSSPPPPPGRDQEDKASTLNLQPTSDPVLQPQPTNEHAETPAFKNGASHHFLNPIHNVWNHRYLHWYILGVGLLLCASIVAYYTLANMFGQIKPNQPLNLTLQYLNSSQSLESYI